jgi:hypothetical protein
VESEGIFFNVVSDVDKCISENCLFIPYLIWVVSNMVPVVIGSLLVAYVEVSYRHRDVYFNSFYEFVREARFQILDFKLSPCSECCMPSSG